MSRADIALLPFVPEQADELSGLLTRNRDFLKPWEPARPDSFFTAAGQRERADAAAVSRERDAGYAYVIVDSGHHIVGAININNVVRGAGQFASLGYWVAQDVNGRGVATTAVGLACETAFGELNLHRLEAGTLLHNQGSQIVLERNGFERYGMAPQLVHIDGRWQDHVLFQRLNTGWRPLD